MIQGTWYKLHMTPTLLSEIKTNGFGFAASLEGGYPFRFSDSWRLELQARLIYQTLSLDGFDDIAARVHYRDHDSLVGRAGLRLASSSRGQGWIRANVWHEFLGNAEAEFCSAHGDVPFRADLSTTWWDVGQGRSIQLKPRLTFFASGDYNRAFNGNFDAVEVKGGLRFNW